MNEDRARPYVGGQAVIEGVMMRSPSSVSVVCRRRSGELVVRERSVAKPSGFRTYPFLRGVATLVESLTLGSRALRWSSELYEEDASADEREPPPAPPLASLWTQLAIGIVAVVTSDGGPSPGGKPAEKPGALWAVLPIALAVILFVALPQAGAEGLNRALGLGLSVTSPGYQAITGCAKLLIIVAYLTIIRQVPEILRMFQYHGAEHKAISTYEAKAELVVGNARPMTRMHPRCGTTFLVMVALVSVVVFSAAGAFVPPVPGGRLVQFVAFFFLKLPFLPLVAAITYEIQRQFAKYCSTGPLTVLLWPGFLVQRITTAEPDDMQLEVALAALQATLWREAAEGAPPAEPGTDRTFANYADFLADPGYAPG